MNATESGIPNAHARPPQDLRNIYKKLQKISLKEVETHPEITSCNDLGLRSVSKKVTTVAGKQVLLHELIAVCQNFLQDAPQSLLQDQLGSLDSVNVVEANDLPGLYIYPSLVPPTAQLHLLNKLLHRDLPNRQHQTNVHLHHSVSYPAENSSYFSPESSCLEFTPKDPSVHKSFSTTQFLDKKLRWVTLGGQYDWTQKVYPSASPPAFPPDIKELVERIFPMKAEAAIVNFYSPGDQLSLHRDVSEECSAPLVSISLGCDAIFLCGIETENEQSSDSRWMALRLRSGDALLMSGSARYVWHAVPKVLENTCPTWMEDWPCITKGGGSSGYEGWKGWMKGKRINLNVRQMFADG